MPGKKYTARLYQNDVYEETDQGMYFLFISYIRCASRRKWAAVDLHHMQRICSLVIFIQELQCTTSVSAVTILLFFHTANYSPVLLHKLQQETLLTACVSVLYIWVGHFSIWWQFCLEVPASGVSTAACFSDNNSQYRFKSNPIIPENTDRTNYTISKKKKLFMDAGFSFDGLRNRSYGFMLLSYKCL